MRKVQFINDQYYRIYNRGVDERQIFMGKKDHFKFLKNLGDFNNESFYEQRVKSVSESFKKLSFFLKKLPKIVEIVAYSLNPNHYHLILKQLKESGITNFMHKVGTSYTNYFNKKYERSGALFQGPFRAIHIDNNDYLIWLSGYLNGNIEIHGTAKAESYKWSSFRKFLRLEENEIVGDIDIILSQFRNSKEYKN